MFSGFLRQSTASQTRVLGTFRDSTDYSAETGLTIANTDVDISKNGGTTANKNSGGGTHVHNGDYAFTFDATDTNTVGELQVSIDITGVFPVRAVFHVLEEAVYDNLFASSAPGPLAANSNGSGLTEAGGTGDHLTAIPWNASWDAEVESEVTDALNAYDPPTNAEMVARTLVAADYATAAALQTVDDNVDAILVDTGTSIPAQISGLSIPTAAENADAVWDELQSAHVTVGSFGELATEIALVLEDTNELQTNQGNWITATGFSTHSAADVRAEMDSNSTQLAAIAADTNELQTDLVDGGRLDLILDAILADTNELQSDDVPGLIAALNDPTAAAIASAVWATVCEAQGSYTGKQILSILLAVCAGVTSSSGAVFETPNGVATRVSATINASQERTAITLNPSA